ncbi:MAG: primosomal protein N' [Spirochaeta sp. LUC14_002_19_P3]|nr:MAG: primosomal protein N' [Spirochaeta sp. LUC14_002_19_P3]
MNYLTLAFNLPVKQNYTYSCTEEGAIGCRAEAELGTRKLTGWIVECPKRPPPEVSKIKGIKRLVDTQPLFDAEFLDLARWVSELTLCSLGEALAGMLPGGRRESRELIDTGGSEAAKAVSRLTEDQKKALEAIASGGGGLFYLYGSTGSGKTEVFLRAAEAVLARGEGVIYLVPEIALSHHLVESLSHRFPGLIAVLHSGLTPSQRLSQWRAIQRGEARFVLGARSAVFAPLNKLGLVILDEEHEGSYKSSAAPRYHARQIAMRRCRLAGAGLIMGSATPSVEAWHLMNTGGLVRLELSGRPAGGAPPAVRLIDMRQEQGLLSGEMVNALSRVLGEGRQALLFLNRRGFSYHFSCMDCQGELLCRHCSVPLTYHKSRNAMVCHYCGFRGIPPSACPHCGSGRMKAAGFGTEKIEEDIRQLFPEKIIERLDADTARKKGVMAKTLREFRAGNINVLLGTQMVAKGLNAPGLKLAVILTADTALNLPDFRATERTFALIVQVAGRVGRFLPDGEVVIQTCRTNSYPVRLAAENKIAEFFSHEIEQRKLLGFPPFSRLFRLVVRGKDMDKVRKFAAALAAALRNGKGYWELLGPAECPIGLLVGEHRYHLILKSSAFDKTHQAAAMAADMPRPGGVRLEVDIDPVDLL